MKISGRKVLIIILGVFALLLLGFIKTEAYAFNKKLFDTTYTFTKCRTWIGDQVYEIEIKNWTDYEDGEQLQITGKDGNVYLVSANNSMLIKEK